MKTEAPSAAANFQLLATASLKPYARNARKHSKRQVRQIARSIEAFGFTNPVLIDRDSVVIAGHGRFCAGQAPRPHLLAISFSGAASGSAPIQIAAPGSGSVTAG